MRRITTVRICILVNIGVIATTLAWSLSEIEDPAIYQSPTWLAFLLLILLPYVLMIRLFATGHRKPGLICANSWGTVTCFSFFAWMLIPSFCFVHPSGPVQFLILMSLVALPVNIVLAVSTSRCLSDLDPTFKPWLTHVLALVFGVTVSSWGLVDYPRYYGIAASEAVATRTLREAHERPDKSARPDTFLRSGYPYAYMPMSRSGKVTGFVMLADPLARGKTGQRSFHVDETGIIRANFTVQANEKDNPI